MKMTMRKMLAILATLAMLCTVLPLGTLFSATAAEGDVILDKDFEDGNAFFTRSVVENGYIVFDATTADWQNTYAYVNALKANTDYTVSFKAKANKDTNMNFKVNDNWAKDAAAVTVDVTTEWQNYEFEINMESLTTGIVMFSSNSTAAGAAIYYIDDVKIVEGKIPEAPAVENLLSGSWSPSSGSSAVEEDGALHVTYGDDWGFIQTTVNVEANTDYVFTFEAKAANGGTLNANFNKTDWSGNIHKQGFSLTEEWATYTYEFTSGSETAYMLFLQSGHPASDNFQVWYKNVTLYKAVGGDEPDEPADDNLIVNGDFETGDATGWETWQSTTISADAAKDGAYGAHLVGDGGWGGMLNQTVAVEAGKEYKLSFWINVNAMGVNVQVKDGAGNAIDGAGGWFDANKKDKLVEWTFTATDDSVFINFCGSGNQPEDVYVDNFSLVATGNAAPAEPSNDGYIINGDLETGDIAPWDNLWGSCPTAEVIEGGKDSAYALNIVSKQWNHVRQTGIAVEANTDYKITVWAKNTNNMCLLVKDGGDTTDIANVGVNAGDEWTQFTVEFNSGEFTSIIFSLMGGEGTDQYGIFDNIVMEKVGGDEPDQPDEPDLPADGKLVEDFEDALGSDWTLATKGTSGIEGGVMKIEGNAYEEILTSPVIALQDGATYTVSFDIKLINKGEINFQIKNCYEDNAGKGANILLEYISDASVDSWKTYTYTFKAEGLDRLYASLLFVNHANTDFYLDNVVVTSDEEPEEPPVVGGDILNATFDTDDFDGILSSSDISVADGVLQFNVTKDWGNVYTGFEVEANTDYEVSFRAKSALGKTVWVKFHKADWSGDICQETVALTTSWKDYTYTMNSGDNTYVYLLVQYAGYAAEGETVWFDYITVKKAGGGDEPDQPASDNLIVNGDFETGDASGWETWQSTVITEDAAKDGSFGANLLGDGSWGGMLNQTMKVEAGKKYKLSFWINVNKTGCNIQVKDSTGTSIEGAGGWFDASHQDENVQWIFTAPDDTVFLNFCGGGNGNAEDVYVDNFVLAPVEPVVADGPVNDSGFESGALDPAITPGSVSGVWYNVWGSCTATFEEPGYGGSQYALNLEIAGKWSHVRQDKIAVKPNTDYVVWARVKNTTGMSIVIKDGDDTVGITTDEHGAIPEDMTNSWMLHKVEFNSGEYDSVCVLLIAIAEDGGMGTFDDVQIYEKGKEPTIAAGPIVDAGFESAELHSNTTPGGVTGAWYNVWGSCNVSFDTPGHDGSNYALNFEGPGAWQQVRQDGIPVEPNTDYTLIAYVKNPININLVVKTADDSTNIADYAVANDMSNSWIRHEVSFNSGEETNVSVLIITNGDGNGSAIVDNVQIYKKGEEPEEPEPDAPATEGPMSLDKYGVSYNRPGSADANLIVNGSFEDAEGGQWQSILGDTLYVVDDETAPEGGKSLYFNTSGVTENNKFIFYVDVEPNTDYVFSAWVKGAFISADNRFNATFGVTDWKDKFCTYADQKFSNKDRQIVPTAWDNEWHLRSVQFNSGVNVKVGIGFAGSESQMWLDGLALFTVDNGIKYTDPKQVHIVTANPSEEIYGGCADEHNLVVDSSMASTEAQEFWASAEGFKNGFISFPENEYEYGTSLKYTGDDESCYTHAIKWLEVEPNTDYTFSVDVRVVKSGNGSLMLLDGKMRDCKNFLTIDFDQISWDTADWFNVTMTFNSGLFDRIGIAIVDGGGEALIDNMRLFKSEYCIEGGVEDEYVEPPYSFDDPEDPEDPDSPATGVSVMGAVLAVALVPASAAAAFKLRRKKEDEE